MNMAEIIVTPGVWILSGSLLCVLLGTASFIAALRARKEEEVEKRLKFVTGGSAEDPLTDPGTPAGQADRRALERSQPKGAAEKGGGLTLQLERAGLDPKRALPLFLALRLFFAGLGASGGWLVLSELPGGLAFWIRVLLLIALGGLASLLPVLLLRARLAARQREIERAVPDMIDLLILCTEAGLTLEVALSRAIEGLGPYAPALAGEMRITLNELRILPDKTMALHNLEQRTASVSLKYLVLALRQSERYGTSIGGALRAVAEENRKTAILVLENRAARMPALLSVPLILLILPPVIALAAGPGFVLMMRTIGG